MKLPIRHRWRAALRIANTLVQQNSVDRTLVLPAHAWRELEARVRRHDAALDRQWLVAAAALAADFDIRLRWLESDLRAVKGDARSHQPPVVRIIYQELVALTDEFDDVEIRLAQTTIRVRTEEMVLEGLDLGRFDLVWNWSGEQHLTVQAVEPQCPSSREDVTHPHVMDDVLCEGDAAPVMQRALAEGRLCDYFLIVKQTLETYNKHSAYVSLDEWSSSYCERCGDSVNPDDMSGCEACGESVCEGCIGTCTKCEQTCCRMCLGRCSECEEEFCPRCWPIPDRRPPSKICPTCQAAQAADEETDADEQVDETETTETPDASANHPVHAAGVGQVAVVS